MGRPASGQAGFKICHMRNTHYPPLITRPPDGGKLREEYPSLFTKVGEDGGIVLISEIARPP